MSASCKMLLAALAFLSVHVHEATASCNVGESPANYRNVPNGSYRIEVTNSPDAQCRMYSAPDVSLSAPDNTSGFTSLPHGTIVNIIECHVYNREEFYKIKTTVGQYGWLFYHDMGKVGSTHGLYDIIRVDDPAATSSSRASSLRAASRKTHLMSTIEYNDLSCRHSNRQSSRSKFIHCSRANEAHNDPVREVERLRLLHRNRMAKVASLEMAKVASPKTASQQQAGKDEAKKILKAPIKTVSGQRLAKYEAQKNARAATEFEQRCREEMRRSQQHLTETEAGAVRNFFGWLFGWNRWVHDFGEFDG